jgi:glutaredoxin
MAIHAEPLVVAERHRQGRSVAFSRAPEQDSGMRLVAFALLLLAVACEEQRPETGPAEPLPSLTLTDDTTDLLLSYVDDQGETRTATSPNAVPAKWNKQVRVVTADGGDGAWFYVADLSQRNADGSYRVTTMSRADWEATIAARRTRVVPKKSEPVGGLTAIVYGAAWCGPCHDAAKLLKSRGVRVTEVDIERQPAYQREMSDKLRKAGKREGSIPVIDLDGVLIVGFDAGQLDAAIQRASRRSL